MRAYLSRVFCLVSWGTLIGCSSGDFAVSGVGDDGSVSDSASDDTGTKSDTGSMSDTGNVPADSGTTESGPLDGGALDAGPLCPRIPSMKEYDFKSLGCDKLQSSYYEALNAAKVCECDGDCSTTLPNDFCMNCKSFVSPGNDAYRAAKAILDEFKKRVGVGSCPPIACPDIFCPEPVFDGCHGSGTGTVRSCRSK